MLLLAILLLNAGLALLSLCSLLLLLRTLGCEQLAFITPSITKQKA